MNTMGMRGFAKSVSLVVADDHPVVLAGIINVLRAHPELRVIAACADGITAVEAIRKYKPDVAVLDIAMPGLNGIQVLGTIRSEGLASKVVILTATATDRQILCAVEGGAMGVLFKEAASDELVSCIKAAAAGEPWLPAAVIEAAKRRDEAQKPDRLLLLTEREREVMLLVAQSLSNKEIGRKLSVSEGTVKIHLHNVYLKLGTKNRTGLAAVALSSRDQLQDEVESDGQR